MRQNVLQRPGQIEIITADVPVPALGEALVATAVVGLDGSDLRALEGAHPFVELPYLPGHEVAGVVEAVAPDAKAFAPGERVLVDPKVDQIVECFAAA